jgi:hypothetical protein
MNNTAFTSGFDTTPTSKISQCNWDKLAKVLANKSHGSTVKITNGLVITRNNKGEENNWYIEVTKGHYVVVIDYNPVQLSQEDYDYIAQI